MIELFSNSGFINGIVAVSIGFLVLVRNSKSVANRAFGMLALSISLWGFGYWQWLVSNSHVSALFWVKLLTVGSTFIPFFFFYWIISLIDANKKYEKIIFVLFFITVALSVMLLTTNLVVKEVGSKLEFPFWPIPGILYLPYIIFLYSGLISWALGILIKSYIYNLDEKRKSQAQYIFWGSLIGFGGGATNFFLWYNVFIPPYVNFFVSIGLLLFGYAATKYQLFNSKVIATEFFAYLIWITVLVRLLLATTLKDRLIEAFILILVSIFGYLLIRSTRQEVEQREKLAVKTKYLTTLRDFSTSIIGTLDFKQTIQNIVNSISERFGYVGALLNLITKDGDKIYPAAVSHNTDIDKALSVLPVPLDKIMTPFQDNAGLTAVALKTNKIQIGGELSKFFITFPGEVLTKVQQIAGIKTIVAIPIASEDKMIGVLDVFMQKEQSEINEEELDVLKTLANEIGIVLINSELYEEVKSLSAYKTELMSIVAHQLKNPLVVIKGYSSLVQDGTVKGMKMYKEVFKKIKSSANKLIGTLNNILDLHHIEEGKMHYEFQKLELNKMLKEMVDDFQIVANQKGIKLSFTPVKGDVFVNGDPYKLSQIFQNLIDNSLKYTEQGWIKIEVSAQGGSASGGEEKDGSVLVCISDTGRGFTQELGNKLFQKFSRGVEENLILGTGLGLYICKEIVEAHNGKIWAESPGEGKGARFYVSLRAVK